MDTKEVRERAAQLIEECGWSQGCYVSDAGGYCISGALGRASNADRLSGLGTPAYREIERELDVHLLDHWNDEPGRTVEEVLAALRGTFRAAV